MSKIVDFKKFNESTDWSKFSEISNFIDPSIFDEYRIDDVDIIDLLSDINDFTDLEFEFNQYFKILSRGKVCLYLNVKFSKEKVKQAKVKSSSDRLQNVKIEFDILSKISEFSKNLKSFYGLNEVAFFERGSEYNLILSKDIKTDKIEKEYIRMLGEWNKIGGDKNPYKYKTFQLSNFSEIEIAISNYIQNRGIDSSEFYIELYEDPNADFYEIYIDADRVENFIIVSSGENKDSVHIDWGDVDSWIEGFKKSNE